VRENLTAAIDRQGALFRLICLGTPSHLPVDVGQQRQRGRLRHGIAQGLREQKRTLFQFDAFGQPLILTTLTSYLSKPAPKQSFDRHIPFDFSRMKALLSGHPLGERN
jgi:hypothetical protein